jgi:hypothetical protein
LGVEILRPGQRKVRLHFRLPGNRFQFFQYCKSLRVFGEQADRYNVEEVCLATLDEEAMSKIAKKHEHGAFTVDVNIPENGLWDVLGALPR